MKNLFTIGEISKLFDINSKTLRYYDEIDLFKPRLINKENGYRYYSTEQFEQLNTIKYLKALGTPLNKIKQHLDNRSIDNIMDLFETQKKITEEKIKEMEFIKDKIQKRIETINYARRYDNLDIIQEIEFDSRVVAILRQKIKTFDDLELSIRKLEITANEKASIFNGKVGVSIYLEKLRERIFEGYDSIFVIVEGENYNKRFLKVLPKGTYVCVRFNGTHEESPLYYEKLLKYIENKGYKMLEDSVEITLIDFGLTNKESEIVTEIQILIDKY